MRSGGQHRLDTREPGELAAVRARHDADGHAVDVARGRGARDVEVRVRIEPEHRERRLPLGTVTRDRRDGADRDAVVAAHQERNLAGREALVDGVVDAAAPSGDLGEVAVVAGARLLGVDRAGDVAAIDDVAAEPAQRLVEPGHAQRFGAHRRAALACADVGRRTDQRH